MREPAEIRLGARLGGDVASYADEADNFPSRVSNRCGEPLQHTDGTIRQGVGLGKAEQGTGMDRRFEIPAELIDIFEF